MPDNGCTTPMPTDKPTPNGYWSCIKGQWQWIPAIGRMTKMPTWLFYWLIK